MEGFSKIAAPLTRLTQKGVVFQWLDECSESFQKLKTALTMAPILTLPTDEGGFTIYCNASRVELGCVLTQNGMVAQSSLVGQVKACQYKDPRLVKLQDPVQNGGVKSFSIDCEGVLRCHGRLCIPMVGDVKLLILEEAHSSRYFIHPGATKMYQDLRGLYWWKGMKADILKHMTSCLNY
ncbi:uncharacterized protein LOC132041921 [Lycium ferocissimum]|uniref:uncharacterized protein LOC132041921 n=1 Tax=Lycium ferocissimum TaxID=112874 RepID=UPI002815A30C|nr:uncharacterized protein LOC132041921 [Lycium ferocissimum]